MKASELIKLLQKEIEFFGNDLYVVIQHPDDDNWNERDVLCGKRGLMHGFIGYQPVVVLEHADTLLGVEMNER